MTFHGELILTGTMEKLSNNWKQKKNYTKTKEHNAKHVSIQSLNHINVQTSSPSTRSHRANLKQNEDEKENESKTRISNQKPTDIIVSDPCKSKRTTNRTDLETKKGYQVDQLKLKLDTQVDPPSRCKLSSWGLPESIVEAYEEKGILEMFPWQAECLSVGNVLKGGNLVYSAPTSAGKTLVAEILMLKRVLENKQKALMILPFVSIAREKMFYLQSVFQNAGVRVDGYMGTHNPAGGFTSVDIAICTIEKANGLINRLMEENKLFELGILVVDELHMVGDSHRGYLLELLLTKVLFAGNRNLQQPSTQIVGMSATLPNLDVLASWLKADLYHTEFRPVPLDELLKVGKNIYRTSSMTKVKDLQSYSLASTGKEDGDHSIMLCLETVVSGNSVLIFCPAKQWCEKLAEHIAREIYELGRPRKECDQELSPLGKQWGLILRNVLNGNHLSDVCEQLRRCPAGLDSILALTVPFGVAFHHAGLTFDERDIIEGAYRHGHIKVLVATSTLSSGVNLPARRVIIRSPLAQGKILDVLCYKQMVGRAGRKGVDTEGESILLCKETERHLANKLVNSLPNPVQSCLIRRGSDTLSLSASLKRAILEVIASGAATTPEDVSLYASCTLLAASIGSEVAENVAPDTTEEAVDACISYLVDNEFIFIQKTEGLKNQTRYAPSRLGKAVLSSSLSPDEGLSLLRELKKAHKCFVLENELHLVYQVTPPFLSEQLSSSVNWMEYLSIWDQLPTDMKKVGELVGVEERFLASSIRGVNNKQSKLLAIHLRFYAALALHDLVQEVKLSHVVKKYNIPRGVLQSLQQSAATFSGMVTAFCKRLAWKNMELLIKQFQHRLFFGVQQELCDLVRLTTLNAQLARDLYDGGYETCLDLARADTRDIEIILKNSKPFQSDKEEKAGYDACTVWITGKTGVTEKQASELIVKEARHFVEKDLGFDHINWQNRKPRDSQSAQTLNPKDTITKARGQSDLIFENSCTKLLVAESKLLTCRSPNRVVDREILSEEIHVHGEKNDKLSVSEHSTSSGNPINIPSEIDLSKVSTVLDEPLETKISTEKVDGIVSHTCKALDESMPDFSDDEVFRFTDSIDMSIDKSSTPSHPAETKVQFTIKSFSKAVSKVAAHQKSLGPQAFSSHIVNVFKEISEQIPSNNIESDVQDGNSSQIKKLSFGSDFSFDFSATSSKSEKLNFSENGIGSQKDIHRNSEDIFSSPNSVHLNSPCATPKSTRNKNKQPSSESSNISSLKKLSVPTMCETRLTHVKSNVSLNTCIAEFENESTDSETEYSPSQYLIKAKESCEDLTEFKKSAHGSNRSVSPRNFLLDKHRDGNQGFEVDSESQRDFLNIAQSDSEEFHCFFTQNAKQPSSRETTSMLKVSTCISSSKNPATDRMSCEVQDVPDFEHNSGQSLLYQIGDMSSFNLLIEPTQQSLSSQHKLPRSHGDNCSTFKANLKSKRRASFSPHNETKSKILKLDKHLEFETNGTVITDSFLNNFDWATFDETTHGEKITRENGTTNAFEKPSVIAVDDVELLNKSILSDDSFNHFLMQNEEDSFTIGPTPLKSTTPKTVKSSSNRMNKSYRSSSKIIPMPNFSMQTRSKISSQTEVPLTPACSSDGFCIIDVAADENLFKVFLDDWKTQSSFSLSIACEKQTKVYVNQKHTIGSNFVKGSTVGEAVEQENVLVGFSVCWGSKDAYFVALQNVDPEQFIMTVPFAEREKALIEGLTTSSRNERVISMFDFKTQINILNKAGKNVQALLSKHLCIDPKIAEWLIDPSSKEKTLYSLVVNYLPEYVDLLSSGSTAKKNGARIRSSLESVLVFHLAEKLSEKLKEHFLEKSFFEVEMPALIVLSEMDQNGFGFDPVLGSQQKSQLQKHLTVLEKEAFKLAKRSFSFISPKEVSKVLYKELRLPNPGGVSKSSSANTGKSALAKLNVHHPLPGIILEWRRVSCAINKILNPLLKACVLHNTYGMHRICCESLTLTATGRITMREPNMQNTPKNFDKRCIDAEGRLNKMELISLRSCFISMKDTVLLAGDYSQLELRILAHLSNENSLKDILNSGNDVFILIASRWLSILESDVSDDQRQRAKQICYGIIYGMGIKSLAEQLDVEETEASNFMDSFHKSYPGIKLYINMVIDKCKKQGYVETLLGRRRYLPLISSNNSNARSSAERQAVNTTIQGTAADLVKKAMNKIFYDGTCSLITPNQIKSKDKRRNQKIRLVLQLHDELIYEVPVQCLKQVAKMVKNNMESVAPKGIKLPVNMKSGSSWGTLQDLKM